MSDPLHLQDLDAIASIAKREGGDVDQPCPKRSPKSVLIPTKTPCAEVLALQDGLGALLLSAAEKAWLLGRALNKLNAATPHGEWEAWCRENIRYSKRQYSRFMQIGSMSQLPKSALKGTFENESDPLRLEELGAIASIAKREGGDVDKAVKLFAKNQLADKKAAPTGGLTMAQQKAFDRLTNAKQVLTSARH